MKKNTHFGFQTVSEAEKARKVGEVFDSVAPNYDLMNDVMSFGVHRWWKHVAAHLAGVRASSRVLDLAGGTGDMAARLAARINAQGRLIVADINHAMLSAGRDRLLNEGVTGNILYVQADAEHLPFPDDYFDCVTIAFGLRNVTRKDKALAAMHRVLKPGGRALILEFSRTRVPVLQSLYDWYSFSILPRFGKWIAKDEASYRYLAESIRMHPDQETLKTMMMAAGFERCDYLNLSGGIVALHRGYKF
ncbi:MAG: bifunctional demethylmenaquinone methyltransferase/2-methoxy-6-polyprenyl-1,4-benzoquinol methylase UbiE [Gammaproteobacteria bacterium]|nr:MAG: bifunctional demethylmenaquinone methyltransferase/2-methoxy-6-polyprenyl-1,4-benzoquinol methylase UbiE [Gammaproteobacteria bacterium]